MKYASLRPGKGVIELELAIENDRISHIKLTGDFFIYPEEALEKFEQALIGVIVDREELKKSINEIYIENNVSSPGITENDWVDVIIKAVTS
jgi:hypothetical protein